MGYFSELDYCIRNEDSTQPLQNIMPFVPQPATRFDRNALARTAFWGGNEALMEVINARAGYEMDGVWYPSNGVTLEQAIAIVEAMMDEELEDLEVLSII